MTSPPYSGMTRDMLVIGRDGQPLTVVLVLPSSPAATDPVQGLIRRLLIAAGQPCPCDAPAPVASRSARRTGRVRVEHEPGCPAAGGETERRP